VNLTALTEQYTRLRAELLAEFPELAEDERALADTLEGETDLPDVLGRLIRDARRKEAMAGGLGNLIKDETERKARLLASADKLRHIVQSLMDTAGLTKLEQPDFTASIRSVPPKVEVTDETVLPDAYVKITRVPDKNAIREALGRGDEVPGAVLGNGGTSIAIRSR